eukprot:1332814-Amorphochlora_amoeboformis.AAC.2
MSGAPEKSLPFKLVLLGDSNVGKSSIVLRFVRKQFFEYQESTIGGKITTTFVSMQSGNFRSTCISTAAFSTQTVKAGDYTVKFEIWDTAGKHDSLERYHSLAPMYYRGASAAIIVYDITNQPTLQRAKAWVKELQRQGNPNIVIVLAGNKVDLAGRREVDPAEVKLYAQENNIMFMETSAKTNHNITELFEQIAHKLPKKQQPKKPGIYVDPVELQPERKSCC